MKISILGTGAVGKTLAAKFVSLDHEVMMGTRDPSQTLRKDEPDMLGNPPFHEWHSQHQQVQLATFPEAVAFGQVIFIALQGAAVTQTIKGCNSQDFHAKLVIDISNPLDFSQGFPPLMIPEYTHNTSLGEEVQKLLPDSRVVKALNTINALIMVDPASVNHGNHTLFICGNDLTAKQQLIGLLEQFGWQDQNFLDLGDISHSRGTETWLLLWARILGAIGTAQFSVQVVK